MAEESSKSLLPFLPEASELFMDPLEPSSDMSLHDRFDLIMSSKRPWGEFFDISKFNLPPKEQISQRIKYNIKTYFYNYFLVVCFHIALYALIHFKTLIALLVMTALIVLKIRNEEHIDSDKENIVKAVIGIIAVILFIWANGFSLIFSIIIFSVLVIGVHSTIRDDTDDSTTEDI